MSSRGTKIICGVGLLLTAAPAMGQYDLSWFTFDAGGAVFTTGGDFELSGTIGQPDANAVVLTGGDYELTGGFWPGVIAGPQFGLGDLNCNGTLDAFDIDPFVLALTDPDGYATAWPDCDIMLADINGDGLVDAFDIDPFIELLVGP